MKPPTPTVKPPSLRAGDAYVGRDVLFGDIIDLIEEKYGVMINLMWNECWYRLDMIYKVNNIIRCNSFKAPYGATYTTQEATDLVNEIEGIIKKAISESSKIKAVELKKEDYFIALACPCCGGAINKDTLKCEYCGTEYILS